MEDFFLQNFEKENLNLPILIPKDMLKTVTNLNKKKYTLFGNLIIFTFSSFYGQFDETCTIPPNF
jgi:hypothetical protein